MSEPHRMRRLFVATIGAALLSACGPAADGHETTALDETAREHAPEITDEATWTALASRPRNHHIAHSEVVKFVIDLAPAVPRLYFLQSRHYESHYDFVVSNLDSESYRDGMDFYERVYRTEERPYIVGSLVRYVDAGAWTFELISGDTLSGPRILWTLERLREHVYFGDALRFRPTSDVHSQHIASLGGRLPVATDEELYGALSYQPVQLGRAYGTLRIVRGRVHRGSLNTREILVTDEVPDDLPLVAALITSRFQAPLAHVAVLSGNRGTPDMALRGAVDDSALAALEGQLVRLDVGAQDYTLTVADPAEAQAHWAGQNTDRPTFTPPLDLTRDALIDQCALTRADIPVAGAKAANMGELCGLSEQGIVVPTGFVVPFAHYVRHLERNHLDTRVRSFLDSGARTGDPTEPLAAMQAALEAAPIDAALLAQVRDRIRAIAPGGRVRLRSSTNAEDLPGFNGAGLYSSVAVRSDASDEEIAAGLRHIWASVWNLGAFQEREHYHIDHARVAMAVLVQVSIDDGVANGVAITANPYDPLRNGVLINVQRHGASVTGAHGDQIPEQWLVFTYLPAREPELLTRSSLSDGAPILGREEVLTMTRQLEAIHHRWMPTFLDGSNAVDVEMLVREDRSIVYVQARPYRVVWQGREGVTPP